MRQLNNFKKLILMNTSEEFVNTFVVSRKLRIFSRYLIQYYVK